MERQKYSTRHRERKLFLLLTVLIGSSGTCDYLYAETSVTPLTGVTFNSTFLELENLNSVDVARYADGANVSPGVYSVSVVLNGLSLGKMDIELRERADHSVFPCLSDNLLRQIPFRDDRLPDGFFEKLRQCVDINTLLEGADVRFDSNQQQLTLQLPQLYVSADSSTRVSPELWDSGIPAAILGYNLNGYQSASRGEKHQSFYAGLNSGINIGAWYLRHNGSYNWNDQGQASYDAINTYLQRDIPAISARALLGQANTRGDIFDTLPFTGAEVATDERMLPGDQRGYAPEIRGIARTAAKVIVRQNDQTIYQTTVSPGAFLIDDLYPTGYGGDLDVTIEEADGSIQQFSVPYAAVVEQLRPGSFRYELVGGTLRDETLAGDIGLWQGTLRYGINNLITGYGGFQYSQNYTAFLLGAAMGTRVGAFSFDVTQANADIDGLSAGQRRGQSYRLSYSKTFSATRSTLSIASYRFSSSGYMDFMTAQQTRAAQSIEPATIAPGRARSRFSVSANQGLPGNWGQFYLSGYLEDYWNKSGTNKQYQVGYNNTLGSVSFGLSAGRTFSINGAEDSYLLTFSIPLGSAANVYRPTLQMQLNHDSSGRTGEQATISGAAGAERQISYSATAMNSNQNVGSSLALNTQYRSSYTGLSASFSAGKHYRSESVGANGSMVIHSGGITLSAYSSDTFALVDAQGASGAGVSGYPGIHIDPFGYALVPYLDPYQLNVITLDPKGTDAEVEMNTTERKIAPYFGSVVKVKFGTKRGTPIVINATLDNKPVPFGASVEDEEGHSVGLVGQGGQIYARVENLQGRLGVYWGENQQCEVKYHLLPVGDAQQRALQTFDSVCYTATSVALNRQHLTTTKDELRLASREK